MQILSIIQNAKETFPNQAVDTHEPPIIDRLQGPSQGLEEPTVKYYHGTLELLRKAGGKDFPKPQQTDIIPMSRLEKIFLQFTVNTFVRGLAIVEVKHRSTTQGAFRATSLRAAFDIITATEKKIRDKRAIRGEIQAVKVDSIL